MTKPRYPLDQSPLYKIGGPRKLKRTLRISNEASAAILARPDLYRNKQVRKKDGSPRDVVAPHYKLKAIQAQIRNLLSRIEVPDYLHCPVKGRSYITAARPHVGAAEIYLCDIADFFPNCTAAKVAWFFRTVLRNKPDIAGRLTSLTTMGGALPQGSPASPHLAFFAYQDMWDELHAAILEANCIMTVYADDITISGDRVSGLLRHRVRQIVGRHGHRLKAEKDRTVLQRPTPTLGTIITSGGLRLPNRQHLAAHALAMQIAEMKDGPKREKLLQSLKGRRTQAMQVVG